MAIIRFYIIPVEVVGNIRGPKYISRRGGTGTLVVDAWSQKIFGASGSTLVAVDSPQADHDVLLAAEDVVKIPLNLDNTIPAGALPTVQGELEALGIPGEWLGTGNTYREVVRFVAGLFFFAQRHEGLHDGQEIRPGAVDLNDTWGDLPAAWRANLQATADSFGYDYSGFTGATSMRVILKFLADQWGNTPIEFGFVTL